MAKPIEWAKHNKLVIVLCLVIAYMLLRNAAGYFFGVSTFGSTSTLPALYDAAGSGSISLSAPPQYKIANPSFGISLPTPVREAAPTSASQRMVITDTSLSMVVTDVANSIDRIETIATENGGYMVNSYLSKPESAASGSIIIRVLAAKRADALNAIRAAGMKVISESVSGQDVTDEYQDLDTRLARLNTTQDKFNTILTSATTVPQILEVQREIMNLQSQIDSVKGQQLYLQKSADLVKISVNLSTDEYSLPYAPAQAWRPEAIFKQAVRSLVGTLRGLGTLIIWIGVYTPLIMVIVAVVLLYRKFRHPKPGSIPHVPTR